MSLLLEDFIGTKERADIIKQKRTELKHILQRETERCERKIALQRETIDEAEHAAVYKRYGELITANLYQLKQGEKAQVIVITMKISLLSRFL